jgi:hypothetical protein
MGRICKISGLILFFTFAGCGISISQQALVRGIVTDSIGRPIEAVSISLLNTSAGTYSSKSGEYALYLPGINREYIIVFSHLGYRTERRNIKFAKPETIINIRLFENIIGIGEITVRSERRNDKGNLIPIPVKDINLLPAPSGNFEAVLRTIPGVYANNELSGQYSVRGGNFDENIVYINDNEVFRPFLVRSGQQEGLSSINPDLVASVGFSSGGFSTEYGDKMSSVLDIDYKKPEAGKGSVNLGLLTSSAHYEGLSKNRKLSFLIGIRYKSSRFMLNTLDTKGDYQPVFADIQSLISYRTGERSVISLLSTVASNTYNFIPQSRESTFGSDVIAYRLYVLFEGGERDLYRVWNNVLSWEYNGSNNFSHKIIVSAFRTNEKESFDIRGWYSLYTLDQDKGSENLTDSLLNIGIGSRLNHARNTLSADIFSLSYKGEKKIGAGKLNWGLRARNDNFNDRMKEWTLVDSAGYSVPGNKESITMASLIMSANKLSNWIYESYLQTSVIFFAGTGKVSLNAGLRSVYDSYTDEFLLSPRVSAGYDPGKNVSFHIAGGFYYQPPFYREMRYPDGSLNPDIKSQKSVHLVLGMKYFFKAWGRPFALSTEIYNKSLSNIIPYRVDNVRIIYSGENSARGFSRGMEFHVNGEFVKDAESWISLSLMDSKLEIPSKNSGRFPSPSDQTVNVNIFFQDYLPSYPAWRAHLNISYVTGIPVISPYNEKYGEYHRLPPYRRVDLGITKVIRGKNVSPKNSKLLRYFDELYAGFEIFNLLDINNTISYYWIKTVNNMSGDSRQFAVPNYLTGRSLNLKLSASF